MDWLAAIIAWITSLFVQAVAPIVTPMPSPASTQVEILRQNLDIPWAIDFMGSGTLVFTERPGRLHIGDETYTIEDVKHIGEGGLLGVAVQDSNIYLYYTYSSQGNNTLNRVVRYKFDGQLTDEQIIIDNIPGASNHNGGRLKFGPDGYLYITTGDASEPSLSQNLNSLAGKILRYKDGKTEVYTLGHRNPQGLAWDSQGQLWETEHGPSSHDEINKIDQGSNYGWPQRGTPELESGNSTWAPSGAAIVDDTLIFAGLRGQAVYTYDTKSGKLTEHFKNQYGRIREVVLGPDGNLYITTSNQDGRGRPAVNDDRILKINPTLLTDTSFTASFEITTLGTKRVFTDTKYHNQSEKIYITASNPTQIQVMQAGLTWADFFATLPMKLDKNCLTTGTGQQFCTDNRTKLRFYLNDTETPDSLSLPIGDKDHLRVTYQKI
jgi:glucose/arabinose dehydrogenase